MARSLVWKERARFVYTAKTLFYQSILQVVSVLEFWISIRN